MIFFISNAIEGQLISTGAFEVSFNGKDILTIQSFSVNNLFFVHEYILIHCLLHFKLV